MLRDFIWSDPIDVQIWNATGGSEACGPVSFVSLLFSVLPANKMKIVARSTARLTRIW